jgi:hypothetical protein
VRGLTSGCSRHGPLRSCLPSCATMSSRAVRLNHGSVSRTQMRILAIASLLICACADRPQLPDRPPESTSQRLEGLKATSKCASLPEETRVSVSARAIESKDGPAIHFRLTNTSGQPLRLYRFLLPWGNANAIELAAVGTNGEIPAVFWPIDDPGPEEPLVLAPGESLDGETVLRHRINEIGAARSRSDVIVIWCYRFTVLGERPAGRISGTVVVPKRAG